MRAFRATSEDGTAFSEHRVYGERHGDVGVEEYVECWLHGFDGRRSSAEVLELVQLVTESYTAMLIATAPTAA